MEEILINIYEFIFSNPYGLTLATGPSALAVAGISAGIQLIGSLFGGGKRRRAERRAAQKAARLEAKLGQLEKNRQAIVNPYADVKDISVHCFALRCIALHCFALLCFALLCQRQCWQC